MAIKARKPRCTVCGVACKTTVAGRASWSRHVYGVFSEPRCSGLCAAKPVVDLEAQWRLRRMGEAVITMHRQLRATAESIGDGK